MAIDKYLNIYSFLAINIVIIILTETVGGGEWFFETGTIHIIAVLFVLLAFARIFYHSYTYDPILEKFVHMCLAAMAVFAVSHLVEFLSLVILHSYSDGVFVNVANMYLISLLLIIIGAESFLRVYHERSAWLNWLAGILIVGLVVLSGYLLTGGDAISLETDSLVPFIYALAVICIAIIGIVKALQIKKLVGMISGFVNYLVVSIILISLAVLPNIFYEFLVDFAKTSDYQATYLSHFAFYLALSVMFLAFAKLSHLGGVLDELSQSRKN